MHHLPPMLSGHPPTGIRPRGARINPAKKGLTDPDNKKRPNSALFEYLYDHGPMRIPTYEKQTIEKS